MRSPSESDQLHSTFALEELRKLARSMGSDEFTSWFRTIFGGDIPSAALQHLRAAVLTGSLPLPRIVLVNGSVQGHAAAYNRREHTILIDRELVHYARSHNDAAWTLLICLIEEFGHHLDNLLRTRYSLVGGDAPLDEGALMASALIDFGWSQWRHRREFAKYSTPIEEVILAVEFPGKTAAVRRFLSKEQQRDDAKSGDLEFFGAGRGSGRPGSYGHESIEDSLEDLQFDFMARKYVYFGNWLRDLSQVIDPKLVLKPGDSGTGLSRQAFTDIIDVMARAKFGDEPAFRVTADRLRVYRPEEHIDNPSGITDGRSIDPDFRGPCLKEEVEINKALRMKNFIRSGGPAAARASRQHRVRDGESLDSIARANGMTWQELARFNFGTDVKQEVTRQLYSKVGCRKRTADGRSYIFTSQDSPGIIQIPGSAVTLDIEAPYTAFNYLSKQLRKTVGLGRSVDGYRHFGFALHTLEDFFSHTNFLELMLIHLGAWVEPWVPANGAKAGDALPLTLTSGKFGGLDTAASVSLGLAEQLQKELECIPGKSSTNTLIGLIILKDRGHKKAHSNIEGFLDWLHELEEENPKIATLSCRTLGVMLKAAQSILGGLIQISANNIDDAQTAFLEDPASNDPTHTQLAKDHDDHPLHALAAELASGAVKDVGGAMKRAWSGQGSEQDVVLTASRYILHPTLIDTRGSAAWMLDTVRTWIPHHKADIERLGSKTWAEYWTKQASKHLEETRQKAEALMKKGKQ